MLKRNQFFIPVPIACLVVLSSFLFPAHAQNTGNTTNIKPIVFHVKLEIKSNTTIPEGLADSLNKASEILSKIFSSEEFKQALYKRNFNDSSFSKSKKDCFERVYDMNGRVSGKGVYENLTRRAQVNLTWTIKNYDKGKTNTMGFSNACIDRITSYDYWLKNGQFLSLRLVRHLSHEFTHISGYRHDGKVEKDYKWGKKPSEDPAYSVGRIVGDIMLDWLAKGIL